MIRSRIRANNSKYLFTANLAYPVDANLRQISEERFGFPITNGFLLISRLEDNSGKTCVAFCNTNYSRNSESKVPQELDTFTIKGLGNHSITKVSKWYCLESGEFTDSVQGTSILFPYSISEKESVSRSGSAHMICNVEDTFVPTLVYLWMVSWSDLDPKDLELIIQEYESKGWVDSLPYTLFTVITDLELVRPVGGFTPYSIQLIEQTLIRACYCRSACLDGNDTSYRFNRICQVPSQKCRFD